MVLKLYIAKKPTPMAHEFNEKLEARKFRWIDLSLIGMGASIALLQIQRNALFLIAMILFGGIILFEAVGLRVVEKKFAALGPNPWYIHLWFYNATLIDVILVVLALLCLGLGGFVGY